MLIRRVRSAMIVVVALTASGCASGSSTTGPPTAPTDPTTAPPTSLAPTSTTNAAPTTSTVLTTVSPTTTTTAAPLDCGAITAGAHDVVVGGVSRSMVVASPPQPIDAPVIVLFHGFNSTAEEILATTGLDHLGPDHGVVVVAPQGIGSPTDWHIGDPSFGDTEFTDRVLQLIRASPCVDPTRIWLAGFSAGSAWTGVYGCAHTTSASGGIAGLLMHSGLAPPICPAASTPNLMIVHGTADPFVPFAGGAQTVGASTVQLSSVPESSAGWAAQAGCETTPVTEAAGPHVEIVTWSGCAGGHTVSLQAVDGLGHEWSGGPGSPDTLNPACVLVERLAGATDPVAACE
ncbi:MAG: hypothetical protein JWM34_3492 [Ilumatobacteraceae bacterium]|nr:hypothetical protein [Ilumatobacteraceae bacterium]